MNRRLWRGLAMAASVTLPAVAWAQTMGGTGNGSPESGQLPRNSQTVQTLGAAPGSAPSSGSVLSPGGINPKSNAFRSRQIGVGDGHGASELPGSKPGANREQGSQGAEGEAWSATHERGSSVAPGASGGVNSGDKRGAEGSGGTGVRVPMPNTEP